MHNMSAHNLEGSKHSLNCFSLVIYAPQIREYENIAKLLTQPSIYTFMSLSVNDTVFKKE